MFRDPKMLLVVEDNPGDARLLREMLKTDDDGLTIVHVETMAEAVSQLGQSSVDIVLLDLGLPDAQGLEAVRRAHLAAPDVSLVVLSGLDDEEMAIEALKEGAQDYLIKGQIDSRSLRRAMRYAIERKALQVDALALSRTVEVARQAAEATTIAKAIFVANMSHEIRTPLHAILGFNELLLDEEPLTSVQQGYAQLVKNAGDALLTVVNNILDYSKLGVGKVELTSERFSLGELVANTVSIVEGSATGKGLELDVRIDPTLTRDCRGDPGRLRQILLNLLGNAVKFTTIGKVTLDVSKIGSNDLRDTVRFAITDTGAGVPAENQSTLFDQFSQADASAGGKHGGTGLGLSISKSLVELMEGRIGYVANENGGSTFWFEVRIAAAAAPIVEAELILGSDERCGLKILLVEDNVLNQKLVCTILEAAGMSVEVANDGVEGLSAISAHMFHVILMDINMPRMDGVTAARMIRDLPGQAGQTPIIALTANAMPHQVREYWQAGMDDFVAKPFDRHQLIATIFKVAGLPTGAARTG